MSAKRKVLTYTLIMLIPAALIFVLSVLLIGIFLMYGADIELMLADTVYISAPPVIRIIVVWAVIAIPIVIISAVFISNYMSKKLLLPLENLSKGVEQMKKGDLTYEFVGSDDSELRALCASFEGLRLQLQKNVRKTLQKENEQKMLLANISHDIRTPVTSIKGYVEGIRDGIADTPEKRDHYLRTIYLKAEAIEQMAENLSIYSKLELGRVQYSRKKLDIFAMLKGIAEEFSLDLQTANIEQTVEITDEPAFVMADSEKMRRVFANIITNAIKYKKPGKGSLAIKGELTPNGVLISFSDSGIGINEKELPHIFDGFYRGDPSRNSKIEGNGLGLSISRRIVSDHGGKIWAKSEGGKGTEMLIILPVIKES
ncbi:MAG: HAMP domain-containing sensor histidine kinase [Clostridia bacterium]|nr:HAMP domain-containing sensor histidine kinase [Clostridia bacterium]